MANFDLELSGKLKSTTKGNADWYYGGGAEAWASLVAAKTGVPLSVRNGKTVGVLETNKIVEYIWHNDNLTDAGLVLKTTATTTVVEDVLTSVSTTKALSSNQGKVLKGLVDLNSVKNSYPSADASKLAGVAANATIDQTGAQIKTAYELEANTNAYTDSEKTKLAGLETSHFKGSFVSLAALNTALPTGIVGDYADVDTGIGTDVKRYIWDVTDSIWAVQAGTSTALTNAQVKTQYEANADTNAYTDVEKAKVLNVPADTNASLLLKVDKATGKGLSTNDFTTTLLNKLNSITAIFTTALKTAYDTASTWVSTNGATVLNHIANVTTNPHSVTKANVGLGSVDNTADLNKPNSNATIASLALKRNILNTINLQVGTTYTIVDTDKEKLIVFDNASAITLVVPTDAIDPLPIGFEVEYVQKGLGNITITTGALLISNSNVATKLGTIFRLVKIDVDLWIVQGDNLGGELTFGAYPNTRSDGALPLNKVFSVNSTGGVGLYDITIFSPPFIDVSAPVVLATNITVIFTLVGKFFTSDMTVAISGQVVNSVTFVDDKHMTISITTSVTSNYYDITLDNGISRTFISSFLLTDGTLYTFQLTTDYQNYINTALNLLNYNVELTTSLHGSFRLTQTLPLNANWEISYGIDFSPYYPTPNINNNIFKLKNAVAGTTICDIHPWSGDNNMYLNGIGASKSLGTAVNFTDYIIRVRFVAGIFYFYFNSSLRYTFINDAATFTVPAIEDIIVEWSTLEVNIRSITYLVLP